MISEKFENLAPATFLDGIQPIKDASLISFICDFEYDEKEHGSSDQFICVGKFHHLEKKWKKQPNVEFIELHQQSQIPAILNKLNEDIEVFYFDKVMDQLDSDSHKLTSGGGNEEIIGSDFFRVLSKYFFSSMNIDDIIPMLNLELKKLVGSSIQVEGNLEEYKKIERVILDDSLDVTGIDQVNFVVPILHLQRIARISFPEKVSKDISYQYYSVLFRLLNQSIQDSSSDPMQMDEPLVILNETQDIFHSNEAFRKLNVELKWLSNLKNGELLSTNQENYLAIILDQTLVDTSLKVIVFFKIQNHRSEALAQGNDEELGIICSSIAHELNNPIGGILNAFQLLQVLNDYDQGTLDIIGEMTKSIKRAHRLVNLFLGFVKKDITRKESVEIDQTLNQAVDLLRGRMIKEGVFIHLDSVMHGPGPEKSFNESILIIIFYILFNESLTAFARETLVKETSQDEKTLYIETKISKNSMTLKYKNINQLATQPLDSHLLKYLLKSQELKVDEREMEIEFIWS